MSGVVEAIQNTKFNVNAVDAMIAKAGEHFGKVIKTMVEGVAFPDEKDGKKYHVFSHSGDDDLGYLTAADVSYAIHFVKQQGRMVGKLRSLLGKDNMQRPAYTFAWEGWYYYNGRIL